MNESILRAARARYNDQRRAFDAVLTRARDEHRELTDAERSDVETRSAELETLYGDIIASEGEQTRGDAVGQLAAAVESGTGGRPAKGDFGATPLQALDGAYTRAGGTDRSAALRSADWAHRAHLMPDYARERIESVMDRARPAERGLMARWARVAGDEHYLRAIGHMLADPQHGHLRWTPREAESFRAAGVVGEEIRAMGEGTGSAGGFLLPTILDPTVMINNAGFTSNLRSVARIETTVSGSWNGITSAGATAEWHVEGTAVADATPVLAQVPIPVFALDAYVPYSFEVEMDALALSVSLQDVLTDAAGRLMAQGYAVGTGSGQPTGLATAVFAVSGAKVASATADVIVANDIVNLQNVLPARWQEGAQWFGNIATLNAIAGFQTTNGSLRFPEMANRQLLRRPVNELSYLDTAGNTAGAGNDKVLIYGDPSQFIIVDRVGTLIEPIQHVFDQATGRPTMQRAALLWTRTGSNVSTSNAFKMLTA